MSNWYLDVDCIPSLSLLKQYKLQWDNSSLVSGKVRYLPALELNGPGMFDDLNIRSVLDPI